MQLAGVGRPPGSHFSAGAGGTDRSVARRSGRGRTIQQLHTPHGACSGYRAGFLAKNLLKRKDSADGFLIKCPSARIRCIHTFRDIQTGDQDLLSLASKHRVLKLRAVSLQSTRDSP